MDDYARRLFEAELNRRGIGFSIDPKCGRHLLENDGGELRVSLENITRELGGEDDEQRMARFVDQVIAPLGEEKRHWHADRLYWALEPNDYENQPDYSEPIGDQVDRVLVHYDEEAGLITWVRPDILHELRISAEQASTMARGNLGMELATAKLEIMDMQGVPLAMLGSRLPFKSSLILAPNLKKVVGEKIGWPLLAVVPVRNFLYLWPAEHLEFAGRVGPVVVREYQKSSYPISTEVFRIDDEGIEAIGVFPVEAPAAD